MKYLFFDIECASSRNSSKMCSLGYVLSDENFNIIETDDIMMNPKGEWDFYALEHILAHDKEYYESFPSFEQHYDKIKGLFDGAVGIGHAVINDVRFLNNDCRRYKLPCIDFTFYDGADIYKAFENAKDTKSLAKVSAILGSHTQGEKHESKEDALLVYEYIREICKRLGTNLDGLLPLVKKCRGENKKGIYKYRSQVESKVKKEKDRGKLYEYFVKNVKPNEQCDNKILEGKKICVSQNYEKGRLKEMLLIVQLIKNLGGTYTFDLGSCDVFVKYDLISDGCIEWCESEEVVDEAIENGARIKKVELGKFLEAIGYDESKLESNYIEAVNLLKSIMAKEKNKKL